MKKELIKTPAIHLKQQQQSLLESFWREDTTVELGAFRPRFPQKILGCNT